MDDLVIAPWDEIAEKGLCQQMAHVTCIFIDFQLGATSSFPSQLSEKERRIMDNPLMAPWVDAADKRMYQKMAYVACIFIDFQLGANLSTG